MFLSSYFLAGRIDHGHHDGMAVKALNDGVAMNKAVAKALQIVKKGKHLHMSDHVKCWSKTSMGWFLYDG